MDLYSQITNNTIDFSRGFNEENNYIGSGSFNEEKNYIGSGSFNDENNYIGSGSFNEEKNYIGSGSFNDENNSFNYGILFAISPIIFVGLLFVILILYFNIYYPLKDYIIKLKQQYQRKQTEKTLPIYNCKINTFYIKELNKNNIEKVKNKKEKMECSICSEEINIEKFKDKKTDLIFLNCSHVYHTNCLQSWVKTRIKDFIKPNCPYCRGEIVEVKQYSYNSGNYDNSSGDYLDDL